MNLKKISSLLLVVYIFLTFAKNIFNIGWVGDYWAVIVVFVFAVISIMHSVSWYGFKDTISFFLITFVVSWSFETISILTGFPFGFYLYSEFLGPRIKDVPILIMPAYFSFGYLSWVISHVISNRTSVKYSKWDIVVIPGVAAFAMTIWDLTFDPVSSTVNGMWCWDAGGAFFGVPVKNFIGWYVCVFTIYLLFFLYIKGKKKPHKGLKTKQFWVYPVLAYTIFSLDTVTKPFLLYSGVMQNERYPLDIENGQQPYWYLSDVYHSMALISLFTMILLGLITLLMIDRNEKLN